jgi:hypothetical protein
MKRCYFVSQANAWTTKRLWSGQDVQLNHAL